LAAFDHVWFRDIIGETLAVRETNGRGKDPPAQGAITPSLPLSPQYARQE
jgi:hypothetical protein